MSNSQRNTPKSSRGIKGSQQPSLLSFFGTPTKKTSSQEPKNTPSKMPDSPLQMTQIHSTPVKSNTSIFVPKKTTSGYFSVEKPSISQNEIDKTITINKKENDNQGSNSHNKLEIVSKLQSISFMSDVKQTPSISSLFDDSDSFDFEVDEGTLKNLELSETEMSVDTNATLPINQDNTSDIKNNKRKVFKPDMDSDSSSDAPSIELDEDDSFVADAVTESEDEFDHVQESSDDDYSKNVIKTKKMQSRSSSYKTRNKKPRFVESDESELDDSVFDEIDIDEIIQKKSNNLPDISKFKHNTPSLVSEDSNTPLINRVPSSKLNAFGSNSKASPISQDNNDATDSKEDIYLKKAARVDRNIPNNNSNSELKSFEFNMSFRGQNKKINSSTDSKNLAFLKQVDSKQIRAKEFTDKNKERYKWLLDVKDSKGRRVNEPGYDCRTLFIPKHEWQRFTPFEKQYWEIKSKNWDTVVFFKKGKFYELFENDADIGHQHFDLKLTDRVNMRMVGVPESSFEHWASKFVAKGFKVAKVEQMESSLAKTMRERDGTDLSTSTTNKKAGKASDSDKVVRRELTCVLTAGTLVDPKMLSGDLATYCLAIVETENLQPDSLESTSGTSYGIAFVDTSTAKFYVAGIHNDDINKTQLETLLVQISPKEVIFVSGGPGTTFARNSNSKSPSLDKSYSSFIDSGDGMCGLSTSTWRTLKNSCIQSTIWNALQPNDTFWDFNKTKQVLKSSNYFKLPGNSDCDSNLSIYPSVLEELENTPLGRLVYTAVGGLVSYLQSLMLDKTLVPIGNFEVYTPLKKSLSLMVDGATLNNLDIFSSDDNVQYDQNSDNEGTLFHLVNHTITPFGRRLLRIWLCHPLCEIRSINDRLDVVEYYLSGNGSSFFSQLESCLSGLPDLERYLSRVHSGSCRIPEWIKLLSCLNLVVDCFKKIKTEFADDTSNKFPSRLRSIINKFPLESAKQILFELSDSFDLEKAKSENSLVPLKGHYDQVDILNLKLSKVDEWLDSHLEYHRKLYKCNSIVYKSIGKETYQLEIPRKITVPSHYARKSATKDVHRYYTPELSDKLIEKAELNEHLNAALREYRLVLYKRFSNNYRLWIQLTNSLSELDVLFSLAKASQKMGFSSCRPVLLPNEPNGSGFIDIVDLVHPCITEQSSSITDMTSGFVPNNIKLGSSKELSSGTMGESNSNNNDSYNDDANVILLTGPNMGGKSTLIRQVCIAIILAQLGCYIPAKSGKMTVFNRIFTRLGARDNLLLGRSTFMVEMTETASFLNLATKNCFVAVDELGRGTSTHDGESVAFSVLHTIASRIGCLSIFSTHYGLLANDLCGNIKQPPSTQENTNQSSVISGNIPAKSGLISTIASPHIRPMYMDCLVDQEAHRVTFLYKLKYGIAERSHGMNVAHMAGVDISIVKRAEIVAAEFERNSSKSIRTKNISNSSENITKVDSTRMENGLIIKSTANKSILPISLLSDFSNLLRVTKIENSLKQHRKDMNLMESAASSQSDHVGGDEACLYGSQFSKDTDFENQNWSCIVDHIQRSVLEWV
ncbi:DNA mismatch repair protein msh6 [Smittium culicis]|uniref:DNA mismatch repair protein n=1 Tax=Smittium culicis TaxID=133412 RepID=A0A1R1Y5Y5_9FUNG|nr:DNA mismatch repair protein msh6 [Smittium culicis]